MTVVFTAVIIVGAAIALVSRLGTVADNSAPSSSGKRAHVDRRESEYFAPQPLRTWRNVEVETSPVFGRVVYADPQPVADQAGNGAVSLNRDWAAGRRSTWFVEEQAQDQAAIGGLIRRRPAVVKSALRAFRWGYAQQAPDGHFPNVPDAFHSTSFFVESSAYLSLFVRDAPGAGVPVPRYVSRALADLRPRIHKAALWMASRDVLRNGLVSDTASTHRRFLVGSALSLTGILTGDRTLEQKAHRVVQDGVRHQWFNGVLPEGHKPDTSYQMIAATYAERWLAYNQRDPLASQVGTVIGRALPWEANRVSSDGTVDTSGNARVNGHERDRAGNVKKVATPYVVRGFAYWGTATDTRRWSEIAGRVARRVASGPG